MTLEKRFHLLSFNGGFNKSYTIITKQILLVCRMKIIFSLLLCMCFQLSFAQKLDINSLEKILYLSINSADSLLKRSKFTLSDKRTYVSKEVKGEGYNDYYYTSYERQDMVKHLLRSLSIMDVFSAADTTRLVLYRTYYEDEQQELKKQLLSNGYELSGEAENNFVYKRGNYTIINKITDKTVPGGKSTKAYEFELGR